MSRPMNSRRLLLTLAVTSTFALAQAPDIAALLERRILAEGAPLAEVQAY